MSARCSSPARSTAPRSWPQRLSASGIRATELHGNLSQSARERNLSAFANGSARVLVATDIAARGIHVDDIALVVHVDPPAEHKAFVHRSGRTARAGATGVVVTLMTPDQAKAVRLLARDANVTPTTTKVTPGHALVRAARRARRSGGSRERGAAESEAGRDLDAAHSSRPDGRRVRGASARTPDGSRCRGAARGVAATESPLSGAARGRV